MYWRNRILALILILTLLLAACAAPTAVAPTEPDDAHDEDAGITPIADLSALELDAPLQVIATTSIIGDVAAQIAGDAAVVTTLLPPGSDPHAYVPTPQDLVALSNADLVLVNGVGLEEALLPLLDAVEGPVIVSVNEGVGIFRGDDHDADEEHADEEHVDEEHAGDEHADEGHGHEHAEGDPHTWQDVANVRYWTQNIGATLSALDPDNAATYAANATAYDGKLVALESEIAELLAPIPAEVRKLVTDHDDLGYFARAHDFEVIGAVIPSPSALASVSAQAMAALQRQIEQEGVRAIFVGNTVNPDLANQLAQDTGVQVVPLYTDALGGADSPAASYIEMMRYNAQAIADALADALAD